VAFRIGTDHGVSAAVLTPDGLRILIAPVGRNIISIWNLQGEEGIHLETGKHLCCITTIACSNDGYSAIIGFNNGMIQVWNILKGILISEIYKVHSKVTFLEVSNDNRWLLSAHANGVIDIWDMKTYTHHLSLNGNTLDKQVYSISGDSTYCAYTSDNYTACVVNIVTKKEYSAINTLTKISTCKVSMHNTNAPLHLLVGDESGRVYGYLLENM
jgi:WD40 repeat protein